MPFRIKRPYITTINAGPGFISSISGNTLSISFDPAYAAVSNSNHDEFSTTSNSFSITNMSIDYSVPLSSTSLIVLAFGVIGSDALNNSPAYATIMRNGVDISNSGLGMTRISSTSKSVADGPIAMGIVDSPDSSGTVTYAIGIRNDDGSTTTFLSRGGIDASIVIIPIPR